MKYALICPNEPIVVQDPKTRQIIAAGYRIAQVETQTFPVGDPTYWLECANDVIANLWYFDTATQQPAIIPVYGTP